ncbi:MAG: hypothetical protein IJP31_04610 [Lachnospiraceae bacterium]|nr:hypothetical protein [Lachnospiraceae bacterium]
MRTVGVGAKKPGTELSTLTQKVEDLEKENKQLKAELKKLKKEAKAEEQPEKE